MNVYKNERCFPANVDNKMWGRVFIDRHLIGTLHRWAYTDKDEREDNKLGILLSWWKFLITIKVARSKWYKNTMNLEGIVNHMGRDKIKSCERNEANFERD